MSGKKYYETSKASRTKTHEHIRSVLRNIKVVYAHFKSAHNEIEVGFSKLQPCTLKTVSWLQQVQHTVSAHVQQLILEENLSQLTTDSNIHLSSYHCCLAMMICNPLTQS